MEKINFRDARQDELPQLLELNQSNLPHVGSISQSEMAHLYRQAIYFRIAEWNNRPAGFLVAFGPGADYDSLNFLWFKNRYPDFVYIDRIIIAAEARRKGIAFALYRDLENFAARQQIPWMTCEYNLRPPNEISRLFHESYGFSEVGTQETENGKKTVSLQIKQIRGQSPERNP
jgi:predicted GNAT superfamily acetyltransferase